MILLSVDKKYKGIFARTVRVIKGDGKQRWP